MKRLILALQLSLAILMSGCGSLSNETLQDGARVAVRAVLAEFLIFNGFGIDTTGTNALVQIIAAHGMSSKVITETEFNAMSADQFAQYRTFIMPGGDNGDLERVLGAQGRKNLRTAVVEKGLNYVGICAGAFIAIGPRIRASGVPESGLAILQGDYPDNYYTNSGRKEVMVPTRFPDGSQRQIMLWSGPYFDTNEGVVARYAEDGKPAIIQARVGNSFVVLSGPHPEAPQSWQDDSGLVDTDGLDWDVAWSLLNAANTQVPLPTM